MSVLHLTLKKKRFDMIASGEKKEEYREIKPYWEKRLASFHPDAAVGGDFYNKHHPGCYVFRRFDAIMFRNGYGKNSPTMLVECKGITYGTAYPEWSDNWKGNVFIIKLGKILQP